MHEWISDGEAEGFEEASHLVLNRDLHRNENVVFGLTSQGFIEGFVLEMDRPRTKTRPAA